ncbi:MAG: hypothetical protein M1813_004660 [Trichoglossum hirsutum]|nr:MAG: hypothetical protein M1813_004660 [Trichoglossum hirsutum]
MAILDDIEVVVVSEDKELTEYDNPDGEDQSATRTTEKLIEASTGMKFAVRYTIKPSFRLHGADGVSIHLYADGQHLYGKTVGATMFRREFSQTHSIAKYFCHERNTWMDAKLAFGSLQIVEGGSEQTSSRLIRDLGTLSVRFRRVKTRKRPEVILSNPRNMVVSEVSEKAIKGRAITNRVIPIEGVAGKGYSPSGHTSISGPHGRSYYFKFHYRSRNVLQMLGCIPKSPSPAPIEEARPLNLVAEIADDDKGVDSAGAAVKREGTQSDAEEICRLRARLAELEGSSASVKSETRVKGEPSSSSKLGIKREQIDRDTSSRKRSKPAIDFVDLTDD